MKRLSILLAVVSAFALAAPAGIGNAGCVPNPTGGDPDPNILCNYLSIPQTTCRGVENSLLGNPQVPQPAKDALRTAGACAKIPNGAQAGGSDANILILGQSTVVPNDSVDVGIGRSIFVHNLDSTWHTFTELGCMDTLPSTPCRFNKVLSVGSWGLFATTVAVASPGYKVGDLVKFRCTRHAGYDGTLEVTA